MLKTKNLHLALYDTKKVKVKLMLKDELYPRTGDRAQTESISVLLLFL